MKLLLLTQDTWTVSQPCDMSLASVMCSFCPSPVDAPKPIDGARDFM